MSTVMLQARYLEVGDCLITLGNVPFRIDHIVDEGTPQRNIYRICQGTYVNGPRKGTLDRYTYWNADMVPVVLSGTGNAYTQERVG